MDFFLVQVICCIIIFSSMTRIQVNEKKFSDNNKQINAQKKKNERVKIRENVRIERNK